MLGLDHRAARATWTVFLILVLIAALYELRETLLVFLFAILLAYLLSPAVLLVNRLSRKRASQTLSLAVVYLLMLGGIGAVLFWVVARAAEEAAQLAATLPRYLQDPPQIPKIGLPEWLQPYQEPVVSSLRQKLEEEAEMVLPMLARAGKGVLSAAGNIILVILVPILSFFLLNDARQIRETIAAQFLNPERRRLVEDILDNLHHMLTQFMKAMVLLGLATFVTYTSVLSLLGLRYSVLLSVVAGAVEFIPVAGPLSASLIIITVAAVTGTANVVSVIVFLAVYRLFLDYVLQPWIMGEGLELPPLAIIFAILAGERLGGIAGMILAVPMLAALRIVYTHYRRHRVVA